MIWNQISLHQDSWQGHCRKHRQPFLQEVLHLHQFLLHEVPQWCLWKKTDIKSTSVQLNVYFIFQTFFQLSSSSITVTVSFLDTSVKIGLFTPPRYLTWVSLLIVATVVSPQSLTIITLLTGVSYV